MSYHRFQNLGELLQGDLTCKLREGIYSKDFQDRECNCNEGSKVDGLCAYNGQCRKSCVVYKVTCRICDAVYIGNTQQTLKSRMNAHFNDVQKLVQDGKLSDTFACHFAQHFSQKPSPQQQRNIMKFEVLSSVNPIGAMKTFGKPECTLCMKERLTILNFKRKRSILVMNACSEIYGTCCHKTRFHRFARH